MYKKLGGLSMYRTKRAFNIDFHKFLPYLPFIIFTLIYIIGIFIGALFVGRSSQYFDWATDLFDEFISVRQSLDVFRVIKESAFYTFIPFIVLFLFGTSIVGCLFIPIVMAAIGLRFGFLSGYMYITYKLNGVMLHSLIVLPASVVALFGLVLLCVESFGFAKLLSSICINPNKSTNASSYFKTYCIKSSITLIAGLISVILDVTMTLLFINFFQL